MTATQVKDTNGVPMAPPVAQLAAQDAKPEAPKGKKCSIGRAPFMAAAPVLMLKLDAGDKTLASLLAAPKEFSTGSFGWGFNGPITIEVGGVLIKVQAGINLTVANSKEAD